MKKYGVLLTCLAVVAICHAQPSFEGEAQGFVNVTLKPLIKWIFLGAIIVGIIFNMGLITNSDTRDYKKFFTNLLIYVAVGLAIQGILTYVTSMSF